MTYYSLSRARMRRLKRRPALLPYEAERLSTRARHAVPRTKDRTRYHPRKRGLFGKETREDDVT